MKQRNVKCKVLCHPAQTYEETSARNAEIAVNHCREGKKNPFNYIVIAVPMGKIKAEM